jgi:hypothetical protein
MFEADEELSKQYPLNDKIKDTDVFLHGTTSKRYSSIRATGYLLRNVDFPRNYSISILGICFEKYVTRGEQKNAKTIDELAMPKYCRDSCRTDGSLEGVVLQITGRDLKKLGCPIYADWNKPVVPTYDSLHLPNGVEYNYLFISIIIVDKDIPVECLKVKGRIPFSVEDLS